jgi:hypothetical protein
MDCWILVEPADVRSSVLAETVLLFILLFIPNGAIQHINLGLILTCGASKLLVEMLIGYPMIGYPNWIVVDVHHCFVMVRGREVCLMS